MPVPEPRPEGHRTLLWLGAVALAGLLLGLGLVSPPGSERARARVSLRLYGERLPEGVEALEVAVAQAEQHLQGWFNLELPDGSRRAVTYPELGVTLDRTRLRSMIRQTASRGHPAKTGPDAAIDLVVPVLIDRPRALAALAPLKEVLDQPALDARLDLDSRAVIPERAGRHLDMDASLSSIEDALQRGAAAAPLTFRSRAPERRASELAEVQHDVLLGYFEAPLEPSTRARERKFNLELAASKLDGHVLMPGDVFDFNATVGPRDEAGGYHVAALVAAGELVDGSGSSTSQLAGTLHAAALFAGLDVVERHPPVRPGAIDRGLDAAVAYPLANLRLKNTYAFPVVLRATTTEGRVRAELRGPERPHSISLVIQLDDVTPYAVIEREDARIERGVRVVAQRGVPGFDLRRYRIRRDGAHAIREVSREHYPAQPEIIHVGAETTTQVVTAAGFDAMDEINANTAGRPRFEPATSVLPPLHELVVMSQSSDPSAPLVQRRNAGRFTVPDRNKDIGAPAWLPPPRTPPDPPSRR